MQIAVILYCVENNEKEKRLYKLSTDIIFAYHIFDPQLFEFANVESTDTEAMCFWGAGHCTQI
jgi:hypothetical protein